MNDVVIVGGGPNGLLLACELRLAGANPVVLEQSLEPTRRPKANGLVGQIVRMMDYRGLYERITGAASAPQPAPMFQFGGLGLELHRLADNPMHMLPIPQLRLEAILGERALELGVEIRRGHEVTGLRQDDDAVTLRVRHGAGEYEIATEYVVGCDGGHSLVRKAIGIDFIGITDDHFVSRSAAVTIPDSHRVGDTGQLRLQDGRTLHPYGFHRTPNGVFAFGMFSPDVYRVSTLEWNQAETGPEGPLSIEEMQAATERVLGSPLPMTAWGDHSGLWRRPGVNSRQAARYRQGRVFLVGDAAHVHSGVGGPGLNLGMQDAINLGWKLAAQVRGYAPKGLLDSYESERFPLGQRVLMHTRAQMALLEPGENVTALRELLGEMLTDDANIKRIAELMTGTEARYTTFAERLPEHPLIGAFMPDLPLNATSGATRVAQLLRAGRPVLLDLAGYDLARTAQPWADRVSVISATTKGEAPADAVLIRPDGYVAWAYGPADSEDVRTSAGEALTTWLG